MRDDRRHILRWLSGMLMLLLLIFTACSKSSEGGGEEPEPDKKKPVLKVYVFAPDHPIVTRADNGDVDASAEENRIHNLDVWVFKNIDGTAVGHVSLSNVELSEAGSEVSIDIDDNFAETKPNVDVYVAANVANANCGLSLDAYTSRANLEGALIKSGYFGVSPLVSSVPIDGLPMSGVLKNQEVSGSSPVLRVGPDGGGLSNVRLVRAVSKIRFVFSKSSTNTDTLTVNSIKLDADVLPNEEYLFLDGPYPANRLKVKASYVAETPLLSDIDGSTVKTNDSPAAYAYDGTMTGQAYEDLINSGITGNKLSELGRYYLRESDKKVSGKITYTIGSTEKTVTFQTAEASDFSRNHTWIVYGYFVSSGNLLLSMVEIKNWSNIETPQEVYNW
ncbi:MAG: hypothetical protein IJV20_05145 [Prevotella sp.]|nr:hypothetical protein [Prevotella sp.]